MVTCLLTVCYVQMQFGTANEITTHGYHAQDIMGHSSHVLHPQFQMFPLRHFLALPTSSTNQCAASFIPEGVHLVNKELKDNTVLCPELGTLSKQRSVKEVDYFFF